MTFDLTKRHRNALKSLEAECGYDDHMRPQEVRFIGRGRLSGGVKIFADLVANGLAITGPCPQSKELGYRITLSGIAALKGEPLPPPKSDRPRIPVISPSLQPYRPSLSPKKE